MLPRHFPAFVCLFAVMMIVAVFSTLSEAQSYRSPRNYGAVSPFALGGVGGGDNRQSPDFAYGGRGRDDRGGRGFRRGDRDELYEPDFIGRGGRGGGRGGNNYDDSDDGPASRGGRRFAGGRRGGRGGRFDEGRGFDDSEDESRGRRGGGSRRSFRGDRDGGRFF